jgi:hypothetical protein
VESKKVKTGSNLPESSKVGYSSKKGCFTNGDDNDNEYWRAEIGHAFELILVVNCHKNEFYNCT